jgi:SAM-dependent methyltransferase
MMLRVPVQFRRDARRGDEEASVRAAAWLLDYMCRRLGIKDLGQIEVLDVGCGVRFTQALLRHSLPVRRYVGIDVYRAMIEYLKQAVDDPRFEYHHLNAHNELYNPEGEPLAADTALPVGSSSFDLICLFSVFTHMAPHDSESMLHILRRHIRPDGKLFFSLYIDELTEGGHGLMDGWAKRLGESVVGTIDTFKDMDPKKPLRWAVYSERFVRELIEDAGWKVESLSPPETFIQHHFICTPA